MNPVQTSPVVLGQHCLQGHKWNTEKTIKGMAGGKNVFHDKIQKYTAS